MEQKEVKEQLYKRDITLMFDKIIENLVLIIVFGVLIIGTFVMVYSSNKMNQMYFDSPIIETNTDKIDNYKKTNNRMPSFNNCIIM